MNLLDPTGEYVVNCAQDDADCQKNAAAFEAARQELLKEEYDERVRAAAASWGELGEENGVTVTFGPLDEGIAGEGLPETDHTRKPEGHATLIAPFVIRAGLSGVELLATVAHEGSHVRDYQSFVAAFDPKKPFDSTHNITHEESERRAYMITHLVYTKNGRSFTPSFCSGCTLGSDVRLQGKVNQAINKIVTSSNGPYKDKLTVPLFPLWRR